MEKFRPQPENQKPNGPEPGASQPGQLGKPPPEQSAQGEGSKSPEGQPILGVWDILTREVMLYSPESTPRKAEEYLRERHELNRLEEEIKEKGTNRDKLILDLYTYKTLVIQPGSRTPLSPMEFQQFRLQVEPLSDEEIADNRRALEEGLRVEDKIKVYHTVHPAGAFTPGIGFGEILR